jgi:hypothetical protein
LKIEDLQKLISFNKSGVFSIKKNNQIHRRIFPDEDGYLRFYQAGKKYKLKANKIAWELSYNEEIPQDKVVIHKNLDFDDYRLQNLMLVTRVIHNAIKEAQRNLSGALRLVPHATDAFSYILMWRQDGKDKTRVVQDIVVARKLYAKLQLKYAKILSKWCVFDL